MTLVMVKTGNVIQHPDPDALFVEAPKVGINDLLCQHGFTGEQF